MDKVVVVVVWHTDKITYCCTPRPRPRLSPSPNTIMMAWSGRSNWNKETSSDGHVAALHCRGGCPSSKSHVSSRRRGKDLAAGDLGCIRVVDAATATASLPWPWPSEHGCVHAWANGRGARRRACPYVSSTAGSCSGAADCGSAGPAPTGYGDAEGCVPVCGFSCQVNQCPKMFFFLQVWTSCFLL